MAVAPCMVISCGTRGGSQIARVGGTSQVICGVVTCITPEVA